MTFPEEDDTVDYDEDKVDDVVLALMYLTIHDEARAWKGFDWDALNRLHEKGFIAGPGTKQSRLC